MFPARRGNRGCPRSRRKLPGHLSLRGLFPHVEGGKGAASPGLGASGSLHLETCCSPSPKPAALPPHHIPEAVGPPT